jgi:uncharacterized membrane protein YhaH (DUF805 family)
MYFYFVCFLMAVFAVLHVMDRFSTETLLGIEKAYQNDEYVRTKLNENRLSRDVLELEKNKIARILMRKFGVHNGLWLMTVFVFIPMVSLLFLSIMNRTTYSAADDMIVVILAFMAGLLTHQTGTALYGRKVLRKIEKERNAL